MIYDGKRLGRYAKPVLWTLLLNKRFWTVLLSLSVQPLTGVAAVTVLRAGPGVPDGVDVPTNLGTTVLDHMDHMEQPVRIGFKEDVIKLKSPDSYMPDARECILGQASYHLQSWLMANATINHANTALHGKYIDVSYSSDDIRRTIFKSLLANEVTEILYVSLAHRTMSAVPYDELFLINITLQCLSVAGNRLQNVQFPPLLNLRVLDMRNCGLVLLENDTFATVANLEQLYLSHNYLLKITAAHMRPLAALHHLDLAYNENGQEAYYSTYLSLETVPDPYTTLTEGLELSEDVFAPLARLAFLDLSHTKLLPASARAFRNLAVEQLSLCYTGISIIVGTMMYGALRALDISGNPGITAAIHHEHEGMAGGGRGLNGNIEVLACENASVKYLDWVAGMVNLRVLLLNYNNINQLTNETFATLGRLEVLDLSANHISNWRWRIFTANPSLAVLDLSANNLNVLTNEMLGDFEQVRFLAVGQNNFMCHCLLRELIDMAMQNPDGVGCIIRNLGQYYLRNETETERAIRTNSGFSVSSVETTTTPRSAPGPNGAIPVKIRSRSMRARLSREQSQFSSLQTLPCAANDSDQPPATVRTDEVQLIQLIDYDAEAYRCRDLENGEYPFEEQEKCTFNRAVLDELFLDSFNNTTATVIKFLLIFFGFALVAFIIYVSKWDYVKYFCIILRNATVLSIMRHKGEDLDDGRDRRRLSSSAGSFVYDVFVSYSEHDRKWILDELLPNLERSEDIRVCLHERDFKVGVGILENIIHCMDQSRTLLLVISECFLLSHWCQFEMHLAQHRLLETRREHLILVFLEDIPKLKRPRTLQYLMKTKTYIKWPTASGDRSPADDHRRARSLWNLGRKKRKLSPQQCDTSMATMAAGGAEERQLFWQRLKKAIHDGINWEPNYDHSISSNA